MTPLSPARLAEIGLKRLGSDNEWFVVYGDRGTWTALWEGLAGGSATADADTIARFRQNVAPPNAAGCWLWTGAVTGSWKGGSHGRLLRGRRQAYAHRVAYELFRGPIPVDLCVCHTCDVPRCVNPWHLFLGTQGDNVRDARDKGRLPKYRAHRKMSPDQVVECLDLRRRGWEQAALAHRYTVSAAYISMLCSGKRRQYLPTSDVAARHA
jgi:hypothetical protein